MYNIEISNSGSGFILNNAAPRPRGEQYEILKFGEKIAIREIVSNEMIASALHYSQWNNGAYGDVESAIEDIESIIFSGDSAILGDILAEIQSTNTILQSQTNDLLQDILDSNVSQEALITASNTLLTGIRTDLTTLHNDNVITNQQLTDANTELDNIEATLNAMEVADGNFYTAMGTSQAAIIALLNNIDTTTGTTNTNLATLIANTQTLIDQTDAVESSLDTINTTLTNNQTVNVGLLTDLKNLLTSIDANTDGIETQLTSIIAEHDQTQVLISDTNTILDQIKDKPNETEILICVLERQVAINDFEDNTTQNFDNTITFIDGYAEGLRLGVPDGEDEVDATFDNLTEGYSNTLKFSLEFGAGDSSSTNNLIVSVLDADDNSVISTFLISESDLGINDYQLKFIAPASEKVIVRFNTSNLDAKIFVDNVSITQNATPGSLVKQYDDLGAEIVANRKFYISGVQISEPAIWNEGICQLDTTALLAENNSLLADIAGTNSDIDIAVTPRGIQQKVVKLTSTNQDITLSANSIIYLDVVIIGTNQTGTVEINNSGNDLIELDTEVLFKYERKFDTYQNKVSPHDLTVKYTGGSDGYMLVEFGLL